MIPEQKNPKGLIPDFRKAGPALSLGLNMAVGIVVLTFIGYHIDRKFGTGEVWTLCGLFLGLLYGAYEVWAVVQRIQKNEQEKDPRDGHENGTSGG